MEPWTGPNDVIFGGLLDLVGSAVTLLGLCLLFFLFATRGRGASAPPPDPPKEED